MSGRKAKAARRAAAAQQAASGRGRRKVQVPQRHRPAGGRLRRGFWLLLAVPVIVAGLYALTVVGKGSGGSDARGSAAYPYAVGSPGPGDPAPPLTLPSTSGGAFDLASYRGKAQVLLYFQEGLTCQPCWDQLLAIQKDLPKLRALGIDQVVTVTTDPIDQTAQKVRDEGIRLPVLADVGAQFSSSGAWGTNRYQMQMMGERNGHSFVLVGKDGRIRWRADYGGAPKYTMFVPQQTLLADLRAGMSSGT